jgi:hypothetical protein
MPERTDRDIGKKDAGPRQGGAISCGQQLHMKVPAARAIQFDEKHRLPGAQEEPAR